MNTNSSKVATDKEVESYKKEIESLPTMSAKIRFLNSKGLTRGQISKTLQIRYQWVRNVLITPIKKAKV